MSEVFRIAVIVATWCSTPGYTKLQTSEVQKCREEVMACLEANRPNSRVKDDLECLKKVKLK